MLISGIGGLLTLVPVLLDAQGTFMDTDEKHYIIYLFKTYFDKKIKIVLTGFFSVHVLDLFPSLLEDNQAVYKFSLFPSISRYFCFPSP